MLNPELYQKLRYLYHDVVICDEDVPAELEFVDNIHGRSWQFGPGGRGEQYRINCPFCGDTKKHLYISYASFRVFSINGESLGKNKLIAQCYRRRCLNNKENMQCIVEALHSESAKAGLIEGNDADNITVPAVLDNSAHKPSYQVSSGSDLESLRTWYPDYKPMSECTDEEVLAYMQSRGISEKIASDFNVGYGPAKSPKTGQYYADGKPFIMLPIQDPIGTQGMQLRALPQYQGDLPKYLFHPACKRNFMLYNRANAIHSKLAVIVEGAFDAMKVGNMAVAIFGHTPSKMQLRMLEHDFRDGGVIWLPDMDIKKSISGKIDLDPPQIAKNQCAKWNASGMFPWGAHVVELPAKDAGSMSTEAVWLAILRQTKNIIILDYIQEYVLPALV